MKQKALPPDDFLSRRHHPRGVDAELDEMNLVGSKEPVRRPDDHCRPIESAGRQVIGSRGRGGERDRARQLGVHAGFPAKLFQDGLNEKSCRRGRA